MRQQRRQPARYPSRNHVAFPAGRHRRMNRGFVVASCDGRRTSDPPGNRPVRADGRLPSRPVRRSHAVVGSACNAFDLGLAEALTASVPKLLLRLDLKTDLHRGHHALIALDQAGDLIASWPETVVKLVLLARDTACDVTGSHPPRLFLRLLALVGAGGSPRHRPQGLPSASAWLQHRPYPSGPWTPLREAPDCRTGSHDSIFRLAHVVGT